MKLKKPNRKKCPHPPNCTSNRPQPGNNNILRKVAFGMAHGCTNTELSSARDKARRDAK